MICERPPSARLWRQLVDLLKRTWNQSHLWSQWLVQIDSNNLKAIKHANSQINANVYQYWVYGSESFSVHKFPNNIHENASLCVISTYHISPPDSNLYGQTYDKVCSVERTLIASHQGPFTKDFLVTPKEIVLWDMLSCTSQPFCSWSICPFQI